MNQSYPWYIADWRESETRIKLSLAERGLYRELLDYCYLEGSVPTDEVQLSRIACCTLGDIHRHLRVVRSLFYEKAGRLYHAKADEVLLKLERYHEQKKHAGAASGKSRRERALNSRSRYVATEVEPSPSPAPAPSPAPPQSACAPPPQVPYVSQPRRALPASKLNGHGAEWSAALYARHPKKKDEALVGGALFRVMEEAADPPALFAEIDRVHRLWCATFDWSEKNGRFAPVLAAWLMDHGWTVEPHEDRSELERMMDRI